jgi:hypothetical protein
MANPFEGIRDRWERMALRERKLLLVLGGVLAVALLFGIGLTISNGLKAIEAKNEETRSALRALAAYRAGAAQRNTNTTAARITDDAPDLVTYLNGIVNELGLKSRPRYPSVKTNVKGGYAELSIDIRMPDPLTITELTQFLEKIETKDPRVVIKEMSLKRDFRDSEKLSVQKLTVVTFRKATPQEIKPKGQEG